MNVNHWLLTMRTNLLLLLWLSGRSNAFTSVISQHLSSHQGRITNVRATQQESDAVDNILSSPEQAVYKVLQALHDSNYPFRLVVVGNGAILETTSTLGPTFKLGTSPRTGEPLTTFASDDKSFEFHMMIAKVAKIAMAEKESPVDGGKLQIVRFLTAEGGAMCSLILADKSEQAQEWYRALKNEYNDGDLQL
jgi:Haem utilisation ChuX/HutX